MADQMLRMAGRDSSGLAKAIKTDSVGNLGVESIKHMRQEIGGGGKNLANEKDTLTDVLIGINGQNVTATGWSTSGYAVVKPSAQVVLNKGLRIAEYDTDKKYITGTYREIATGGFTWTTNAKTRYVRFSNYTGSGFNNTQLEYGNASTSFEPFKESLYLDGRRYTDLVPTITELPNVSSELQAKDVANGNLVSLAAQKRSDGNYVLLVAESALPDSAHAYPIASGTTNVQGIPALPNARLTGFTIANGDVAGQVRLYHGTSTAGIELFDIKLQSNENVREWFDLGGITTPNGIFVERVSGTLKLTLFARATQ